MCINRLTKAKKIKMCALSSQTCFSTIVGVIARDHQYNKKYPCYRSLSELHKNTILRKNQKSDSIFAPSNEKTGSNMTAFASIFETPLRIPFILLFFKQLNHHRKKEHLLHAFVQQICEKSEKISVKSFRFDQAAS